MISLISGLAMTGASGGVLWYFMPHNGVIHPLAHKPVLDELIPISIVSTLAIGVALMVSALV